MHGKHPFRISNKEGLSSENPISISDPINLDEDDEPLKPVSRGARINGKVMSFEPSADFHLFNKNQLCLLKGPDGLTQSGQWIIVSEDLKNDTCTVKNVGNPKDKKIVPRDSIVL